MKKLRISLGCTFLLVALLANPLKGETEKSEGNSLQPLAAVEDVAGAISSVQKGFAVRRLTFSTIESLRLKASYVNTFTEAKKLLPGTFQYLAKGQKYWYNYEPVRYPKDGDSFRECLKSGFTQANGGWN